MKRNKGKKTDGRLLTAVILIVLAAGLAFACWRNIIAPEFEGRSGQSRPPASEESGDSSGISESRADLLYDSSEFLKDIPEYSGEPYCEVNGNRPDFAKEEIWTSVRESLSPLDRLGRCGTADSCIGVEGMPTEPRGDISSIHPTGWHQQEYDFVEGLALYNRCHLIAHMLSGDDAIDRNLVTGTSYMNRQGMQPFEIKIGDYVRDSGNHVMYRVTPVFRGKELVCRGVHMEAVSVEDGGRGVSFNVFCYNVEPGVSIDYMTGYNRLAGDGEDTSGGAGDAESGEAGGDAEAEGAGAERTDEKREYVLNTYRMKFHYPSCQSVEQMDEGNRRSVTASRDELIEQGYSPCGNCRP